jgi:hypothetical protein
LDVLSDCVVTYAKLLSNLDIRTPFKHLGQIGAVRPNYFRTLSQSNIRITPTTPLGLFAFWLTAFTDALFLVPFVSFAAICASLAVAVGAKQSQVVYSVVVAITVNMIQLERDLFSIPFGNATVVALVF